MRKILTFPLGVLYLSFFIGAGLLGMLGVFVINVKHGLEDL